VVAKARAAVLVAHPVSKVDPSAETERQRRDRAIRRGSPWVLPSPSLSREPGNVMVFG
jgi:hypothetical protein